MGARNLCCMLAMLFCLSSMTAQQEISFEERRPTVLGLSFDQGFLIRHTSTLREIDDAYPSGLSAEWSKFLITKNAWEFCNCFPRVGVEAGFWRWDNPEVLGNGVLAIGFVEPYFNTSSKFNFFFRAGLGGAYLSQPYDEQTNPLNESYSTALSFAIEIGTGLNYRLDDTWSVRLAVMYNHTSNGGVRTPNKGLNFPTLSLGVLRILQPLNFPDPPKIGKRKPPSERSRTTIMHFSGYSNASVGDKDKFYVFGFAGKYSRWIGGRSAITGGSEIIFDYSRREQIDREGSDDSFVQAAAILGHEFWLGKVTFSQALGVYYFNEYRINDDIYQRYSLTYNFNRQFSLGFSLKAHRHVADFIDLRVGYTF